MVLKEEEEGEEILAARGRKKISVLWGVAPEKLPMLQWRGPMLRSILFALIRFHVLLKNEERERRP